MLRRETNYRSHGCFSNDLRGVGRWSSYGNTTYSDLTQIFRLRSGLSIPHRTLAQNEHQNETHIPVVGHSSRAQNSGGGIAGIHSAIAAATASAIASKIVVLMRIAVSRLCRRIVPLFEFQFQLCSVGVASCRLWANQAGMRRFCQGERREIYFRDTLAEKIFLPLVASASHSGASTSPASCSHSSSARPSVSPISTSPARRRRLTKLSWLSSTNCGRSRANSGRRA